jgi:hypothetical protein
MMAPKPLSPPFTADPCVRCGRPVVHLYLRHGIPIVVETEPDTRGRIYVRNVRYRAHFCVVNKRC